jgi:hypothetical protein
VFNVSFRKYAILHGGEGNEAHALAVTRTLAAGNGPGIVTISGSERAVRDAKRLLEQTIGDGGASQVWGHHMY